ncbi:Frigida-like [Dillenia turbinata]|uniref:FRIGIDA-like protein n=1 Tax=Dillenia turbinata TaxID=194707 RepID=A0AAN8YZR4_9MAGN
MATQTLEQISIDLKLADAKKENLRKAYEHFQAHSSSIASLTLQWKDLESHFDSIKISIGQRFKELETREKRLQDKIRELELKEKQLASLTISKVKTEPIDYESPSKSANLRFSIKSDGKALQNFLNERERDHELMRDEVFKALRFSSDPATLVLDAMVGFYGNGEGERVFDIRVVRRSCLLLLEQLGKVRREIRVKVKEEAMKLAMEWKGKMTVDNELEVLGFLQLLVSYGDKKAATLCHDLVTSFCVDDVLNALGKLVYEWHNAFGATNDIEKVMAMKTGSPYIYEDWVYDGLEFDHIQECIDKKKHLEAVKLVYAFELVDRFPPVLLLKNHYMGIKKAAKYACRSKKITRDVKIKHIEKQIEAAKAVIECIIKYNLGSEYPAEGLEMRVRELENQRVVQQNAEQASVTSGHPQEQSRDKAAPLQGAQRVEQIVNKHVTNLTVKSEREEPSDEQCIQNRLIEPKIERQTSPPMISEPEQQTVHKRLRTDLRVMASTNASVVASPPVHSTQVRDPPTGFYPIQGAPFLTPPAGQFNMGDQKQIPACMNPTVGAYSVTGSVPVASQTNTSTGPYRPSIARKAPVASHYMPVVAVHGNMDHYYHSNVASNGNIEQNGPGVAPRASTGEFVPKSNTPLSVNNEQFNVAGMYAFPPTSNGTAGSNATVVPSTKPNFSAPSYPAHHSPVPYGHCYGLPPQQRPPHQQPHCMTIVPVVLLWPSLKSGYQITVVAQDEQLSLVESFYGPTTTSKPGGNRLRWPRRGEAVSPKSWKQIGLNHGSQFKGPFRFMNWNEIISVTFDFDFSFENQNLWFWNHGFVYEA